jgi:hypothetical protein
LDKHPAAGEHLPGFITAPGQTDVLFVITTILLLVIVLGIGNLYLRLHALPEQIAHRTRKVQMEIVAILTVLALFTHIHLFWIAALILAFIDLPDFGTPMRSMAASLEKLAAREEKGGAAPSFAEPPVEALPSETIEPAPATPSAQAAQRPADGRIGPTPADRRPGPV